MEARRSTKHRSLGVDSRPQQANLDYMKTSRPLLGDRHNSAPLIPRSYPKPTKVRPSSTSLRHRVIAQASTRDLYVTSIRSDRPIVNLVVFGKSRVGKTTFIRQALNLDKSVSTTILSSQLCVDSTEYRIRLCETKFGDIRVNDEHLIKWPKPIGDDLLPTVDGVLFLYDLTNEGSVEDISQILRALSNAKLPVMLVACKADAPLTEQEVGISFVERMRRSFPLSTFGETSIRSDESAKACLNTALKATLSIRKLQAVSTEDSSENDELQLTRIRTSDIVQLFTMTGLTNKSISRSSPSQRGAFPHAQILGANFDDISESLNDRTEPANDIHGTVDDDEPETSFPEVGIDTCTDSPPDTLTPQENFTPKDDAPDDEEDGGESLCDLVDRLLRMPANKNEAKFVPAFLCLYRAFATPRRLLAEIIDRFVLMEQSDLAPLTKMAELLRYLQVLAQWTGNYPGDFAESITRRRAISFAQDLEQNKQFVPSVKGIIGNLLTIIMDDDRDWAYEDYEKNESPDSRRTTRSSFFGGRTDSVHQIESDNSDTDRNARRRSVRNSGSESASSSIMRSSITSSQSATNLFNLDSAREQARLLNSVPHIPLTKLQWHQFVNSSTEEVAREITRMDWTMYSAIRARDFVRHANLSSQQRSRYKHADTIGMMVKHFNHLALFVSSMILLRDKPKHRAIILEKFMDLAWKVRQLNNYNSLGAIVAGITGPEISRLKHTNELISADVHKQFLRLTVLMNHSRSHASYRMAWENSSAERIPFIPLIRQDLTMAATTNQTFIGKKINWKKFEIMGEVIIGIQRSHDQPYIFAEKTQKSQEIIKLILETKVIEEPEDSADPRGELYERSVQLEPSMAGDGRKSMANLGVRRTMTGWFQS